MALFNVVQLEGCSHLFGVTGSLQILLVGVYEDGNFLEELLGHEGNELIGALLETHVVGGVDHVDNAVGVLVIVLPVGANLTLTTNVPDIEFKAVLGLSYTGGKTRSDR